MPIGNMSKQTRFHIGCRLAAIVGILVLIGPPAGPPIRVAAE